MRSFEVEVTWDGHAIPDVVWASALSTSTDVITFRDVSGGVYKLPGGVDTSPVSFQRTIESDLAFDVWARTPDVKKDVQLRLTDPSDGFSVTYLLHGCWVCGYAVIPDRGSGVVTESITLSVNRWERATSPVDQLAVLLAAERGVEVRRISLRQLMTGRPEETERRLAELLDEAERAGAVLLFDEADAVFARRTQVQDSHDRYQM